MVSMEWEKRRHNNWPEFASMIYRCDLGNFYNIQHTACIVPGDVLAWPVRRAEAPTLEATHKHAHVILSLQHHKLTTFPSHETPLYFSFSLESTFSI
jgi:hypothetical protein